MSVLNIPRLHFIGDALWNPDTPNNSPGVYDENTLQQVDPPAPRDFVNWLKTFDPKHAPAGQSGLNGSWNVYGDGSCWLREARVHNAQRAYGTSDTNDPICQQASFLRLTGQSMNPKQAGQPRMVDVAPYQSTTTQIFYQYIELGTRELGFRALGAQRMFSRWPFIPRNLDSNLPIAGIMGVIFQTSAFVADIEWFGLDNSPALNALHTAAFQNQGITVQWANYRTLYYKEATWNGKPITDAEELHDAYVAGFVGGNPAVCKTTGTIGVWNAGELASAPTQILLNPGAPITPPTVSIHRPRAYQEGTLAAPQPAAAKPNSLGPAMAWLDVPNSNLAVSFLSTIPENGPHLVKWDAGDLVLQAGSTILGTIPYSSPTFQGYDRSSYERTSGILDFPLDAQQLQAAQNAIPAGTLQVVQQSSNVAALVQGLYVAETDQRGIYIDEGDTTSIGVSVYLNGVAVPDGTQLQVAEYVEQPQMPNFPYVPATSTNAVVDLGTNQYQITVETTGGIAQVPIRYLQPGTALLGFFPPGTPVENDDNFPGTTTSFYAAIRLYGADNALLSLPDDQITWPKTYEEVLQVYNLVYPRMSLIIDLSSYKAVVGAAKTILELTDPANFNNTLFMPVTREMSAGKRSLLRRFCTKMMNSGNA